MAVNANFVPATTSIIVPCWNQREFTRHCLQALFQHTRSPWELVVIDNGSTDGTADYLAGVQDASALPVTVITNAQNLGFPASVNQGLHVARGAYLVLLNNDAVATNGWLDQLIALTAARTRSDDEEESLNRPGILTVLDYEEEMANRAGAGEICGPAHGEVVRPLGDRGARRVVRGAMGS